MKDGNKMMETLIVKEKDGLVIVEGVKDFDLTHIFECGQCFRWNRESDGGYTGAAHGKVIHIKQDNERVILENTTIDDFNNLWYDYFDLDRDYGIIKKTISNNDEIMQEAVKFGSGIRLLNQDEWEILISFIISQNRSIPIIKQNIEFLSKQYGKYIGSFRGNDYYDFPAAETLAAKSCEDIKSCKVGYRAPYIQKVAQTIANDKFIYELKNRSITEAADYLLGLFGVGPKVAHCIMLFSMKKYESFPIDVWVQRVMKELYGLENAKQINEFAKEKFGEYGGFAQQYLFYYARSHNIGKTKSGDRV